MNVAMEVDKRVDSARIHGFSLSERYPMESRPNTDAPGKGKSIKRLEKKTGVPLSIANVRAALLLLNCKSLAKARGEVCMRAKYKNKFLTG